MSIRDRIKKAIEKWLAKIGIIEPSAEPPITQPTPTPQSNPQVPVGTDVMGWETIHWYGQNQAKNAIPTKLLRSAVVTGDYNVRLDYDTNSDWPAICRSVPDCRSSFMVFTTAIDGALRGGHVDHMRLDAKVRDLGNFYNGYLMAGVPQGQDLYIAIASHDGRYRSNLVKARRI